MFPLTFPDIDPIIFSLGPLHVRWYLALQPLIFWYKNRSEISNTRNWEIILKTSMSSLSSL